MSCRICKRSSCTESFHSLEEQDLFAQREAMPDDVDLLRRMVQESAKEVTMLQEDLKDACAVRDNAINALISLRTPTP